MKQNDMYDSLMKSISKKVKDILEDYDDVSPKKIQTNRESYIIEIPDNTVNMSQLQKKMSQIDGEIYVYKTSRHTIVISCPDTAKLINAANELINDGILDMTALTGTKTKLLIYKSNGKTINDSVNEGEKHINENTVGKTPKSFAKFEAVKMIKNDEMKRDEDEIRKYFIKSKAWQNESPNKLEADIRWVMRKTEKWSTPISGTFVTDFVFSSDDDNIDMDPSTAAVEHIDWLVRKGLDIKIKDGRYSTKYTIRYRNRSEYENLVNWAMWHLGYADNIMNGRSDNEDRKEVEDIIASGSSCVW